MVGRGCIAEDYTAIPIRASGTDATAYVYGAATLGNINSRISFDENTVMSIRSFGGNSTTNGNNALANSYAIGAYGNVSFKGSTGIFAQAVAGTGNALISESCAYVAYTDDSDFKLFINSADDNGYVTDAQVRLVGDIANYGGEIKITAENSGSYINGTIIQAPLAKTFIKLDKGAQWNLAANTYSGEKDGLKPIITLTDAGYAPAIANSIDVYSLTLGNNVRIDLTSDNAMRTYNSATEQNYRTLVSTANQFNITGSNNTFILNSDISNNIADKIVIDSSAPGTNYIKVNYDPAVFTNTPVKNFVKTLVVEAKSSVSPNKFQASFTGVTSEYGVYSWTSTVLQDGLNWYITSLNLGPSSKVRTAADSSRVVNTMAFVDTENLTKRLGDVRSAVKSGLDASGLWTRYNNGKLQNGGGYKTELSYNQCTLGYDRSLNISSGKIYRGLSISHTDANTTYAAGSGKNNSTMLSLYQTWLGNKGHYYDLVLKTGRLSGEYGVYSLLGEYDKANFSTWATTVSGEYGYSKQLKAGLFLEPQAQVTLGRINGYNYTTSSMLNINADSNNLVLLRLGFNLKQTFNNGSIYLRANYFHNFIGSGGVQAEALHYTRADQLTNWFEIGIGGTWQVGKNCSLYLEADKYLLDLKSSVNIIAGARWTF